MNGSRAMRDRMSSGKSRLDRRSAEMLALDVRMLAKAHGLTVGRIEVRFLKPTSAPHRLSVEAISTKSVHPAEERTADEIVHDMAIANHRATTKVQANANLDQ